ncbi:MAG: ATP-binding cassette domain-containing protein [Frankiaceae bacterium]|nr:ATP-binding cassette domain-containing protein [Frankiaceae bacterium]MBV9870424.1 ATP-binding cassette domain-containing protein [Frankiaceae bacterium]
MAREASPPRGRVTVRTAIEVSRLRKSYGDVVAVDDLSFSVAAGEVFALLGPNGAGKSTTINILCTLAGSTGGRATVAGFDVATQPHAIRRRIGLVFQQPTLDEQLTAQENLHLHAVMYHMPRRIRAQRIDHVLELVGLEDRRNDLVATFSGGMARRLEIARGMLHSPELLFLDEPTVGLDPQTRTLIWQELLAMRAAANLTVLFTTHHMHEAEIADRIAIIDHGRIAAIGTPGELKTSITADTITLRTRNDAAALDALQAAGYHATLGAAGILIETTNPDAEVGRAVEAIGGGVEFVQIHRCSLDDVFLHYTGRQIREPAAEAHSEIGRAWVRRR